VSIIVHKISRQKEPQTIADSDCRNSRLPVIEEMKKLDGRCAFQALNTTRAFSQGEHGVELGFHVEQKNAGWDRTLGKTFNLRAAAGRHSLFAAAALSIVMPVEVFDGLSSRSIVFNRSLWRLILQTQGLR
jgi:hypothetical protein